VALAHEDSYDDAAVRIAYLLDKLQPRQRGSERRSDALPPAYWYGVSVRAGGRDRALGSSIAGS